MGTIKAPRPQVKVYSTEELRTRRAEIHAEIERRAMTLDEAREMYHQYRLPDSTYWLMDELDDIDWLLSATPS
ncbi:MAG: hypothetical protein ACRC0L_05730 [Angustibacter sp.]